MNDLSMLQCLMLLLLLGAVFQVRAASANNSSRSQTTTTTTTTNSSQPKHQQQQQPTLLANVSRDGQLYLAGKCGRLSSCLARDTNSSTAHLSESNGGQEQPCYCDTKCSLYEDCCRDFNHKPAPQPTTERRTRRRHSWHCLPVNEAFGSVLVRASCEPHWHHDELVARRCSYLSWLSKRFGGELSGEQRREYFSDPVGMMLPITDLSTGITYANSYCLRCNRLGPQPRLQYWQPLLECNYLLDVDDRNALFDHISAHQGDALEFSDARGQWIVKAPPPSNTTSDIGSPPDTTASSNTTTTTTTTTLERTCQVMPTAPESAEHLLRYCHYPVDSIIDTCPGGPGHHQPPPSASAAPLNRSLLLEARRECQWAAQELVYSHKGDRLYLNTGCAICNHEPGPLACKAELEARHRSPLFVIKTVQQQDSVASRGGQAGPGAGASLSGSFSLLMDISGRSQADNIVGQVHQCPDTERQIFDPFYLACRDIICGFKAAFNGNRCEQLPANDTADRSHQFRLVDKFNDTMSIVSASGLMLSILALSLFLLLHWLSMFDLRSLLIKMAQADAGQLRPGTPLERQRGSKTSTSSTAARESLSSRGVACLAASLLLAYLLFLAGHQQLWPAAAGWQCTSLAGATYGAFLLAFNWMFLLSYDIWRTLRLATCRLRVPAAHAQSLRFLCYALLALLSSGALVGLALLLDLNPDTLSSADCTNASQQQQHQPATSSSWDLMLLQYKPNFGKRAGSCWFANRRALALFFGAPITLITLLNLLFFLHSSCMVVRTSSRSSRRSKHHSTTSSSVLKQASEPPSHQPSARKNSSHLSQDLSFNCDTSTSTSQSAISYIATTTSTASSSPEGLLIMDSSTSSSESCSGSSAAAAAAAAPSDNANNRKRPHLHTSNSSSSLANQSLSGISLATSLANKYDAQKAQLQALATSLAKDYRLYCRLATIMGLTWLTGLLASYADQAALWYLFVVLNTLQGLFIFIAFGCKSSKLHNLLILFAYLRFKSSCWRGAPSLSDAAASSSKCSSSGSSRCRCKCKIPSKCCQLDQPTNTSHSNKH